MLKSILFGISCLVIWSIVAVGSLFLGGCGGGEGDTYNTYNTSDMMCTPGQSVLCFCPGALQGYQVCNSYGNFDSCRCPKPEADAGTSPEASPEKDAETDAQVTPDAEVGADAQATPDAETDAEVDSGPKTTLEAILGFGVVNGVVVKKDTGYSVIEIELTANSDADATKLILGCTASINGAEYAPGDCWKRVTSVSLWDGATQIGLTQAPDMQGVMVFSNLLYHVPQGTTRHLHVKVSLSSSASDSLPHDRVAFGLYTDGITAQDSNLNAAATTVSTVLASEQFSTQPAVSHEILPHGSLSVEYTNDLSAYTLTGSDNAMWNIMAKYRATSQYEASEISRANAYMPADLASMRSTNEDCSQIGVGTLNAIHGTAVMPVGQYGLVDVDLSSSPITVPKDGNVEIVLWCLPAKPLPSAIAGFYSPRTGDRPALGLNHSLQVGEWNANYVGKANLRTTGQTSGERLYAHGVAEHGPFMVLRGNNLFVTKLAIPSTNLQLGEMPAYNFSVMVSPYGTPMGIAQFAFNIQASPGVKFRPRLYKGNQYADAYGYSYSKGASEPCDNENGNHCFMGSHQFLFRFYSEQVIQPGSTVEFTLALTANKLPAGSSQIEVSFVKQGEDITGQVINLTCLDIPDSTLGLGLSYDQYSRPGIIASDMTEIPHMLVGNCGVEPIASSADFFGDFLLLDHLTPNTLSN